MATKPTAKQIAAREKFAAMARSGKLQKMRMTKADEKHLFGSVIPTRTKNPVEKLRRVKVETLAGSPVSVWYSSDWQEYQVKIAGVPKATYHTDDKQDALQTAQRMRNDVAARLSERKKNPLTRVKVSSPSMRTGEPASRRLKARRRATVKAPEGYFANPLAWTGKKNANVMTGVVFQTQYSTDGKAWAVWGTYALAEAAKAAARKLSEQAAYAGRFVRVVSVIVK